MRLNQAWIQHYGPLQKEINLGDGINVIRGPNESGKSLLVEALLKQFVDGSIPSPRIGEKPDGYVELEVGDGSKHKLGDGETLTGFFSEYYNIEVRPSELQNVFVVRNGDLSSGHNEEFYSHITDKLTGRRVEDIDTVKDVLFDAGRITESYKKVSSDQKYNGAGDQLWDAEQLKSEIEDYVEKAREAELTAKESRFFGAKRREEELEEKLEALEEARENRKKAETHEELRDDRETIESNLEELDDLPESDALDDIDTRLRELSETEGEETELAENKESNLSLAKWSIAGATAGFIASLIFGAALVGLAVAILFLSASGYFWRKSNDAGDKIAELRTEEEEILSDARAAGLHFEGRDDIRGEIAEIEKNRNKLQKENQGKKAVLERELGFESDSIGDAVEKAEDGLEELQQGIDESVELEFEEGDIERTKEDYEDAKETREKLEEEISNHRDEIRAFGNRAHKLDFNHFVGYRLELEVENLDALEQLEDRLDEFISTIEKDAEAARVAIDIFEQIQEEEREETAELFEEGSRATEIFQQITDERYNRVSYDNEENRLIVEKSTGESFVPEQLSEGTRDQLYLSIRVALAEQILDEDAGFFIMDDAFLTSDTNRLSVQGNIVEELVDRGWQVIYLTAKQDAADELTTRSGRDPIELPALE